MKKTAQRILEEMREEIKGKTFQEVSSIGWKNHEPIKIGLRKYYPSTWSQEYDDNKVLLVVQLTKWYIPNFLGATDCIGFIQDRSGETSDVDAYWLMHEIGHP